jgi:diguanylate cyclase (GGDEF)-like protein
MNRLQRLVRGDVGRRTMGIVLAALALSLLAPLVLATPLGDRIGDVWVRILLAAPVVTAAVAIGVVLASSRRLSQVQEALDATQAAIAVYDARDRLVIANKRYREILQLPDEAFVPGITYSDLVRRSLALTHTGAELDDELAFRLKVQHEADGQPTDRVYPGRRWVRVTKSRTETGLIVGIALDVTAYHDLKAALETESRRYEALASGAPVGIAEVDTAGAPLFVNGALLDMLGAGSAAELASADLAFEAGGRRGTGFTNLLIRLRETRADSEVRVDIDGERRDLLVRKAFVATGDLEARVLPVHRHGADILIFVDITERKGAEARIRYLAHHDALTGALNRLAFNDDLAAAASNAGPGRPASLIAIDLDRFKPVNDVYGHAAGDELLRQIVRRVTGELAPGATLYRMGGDEFAVLSAPGAAVDPIETARRVIACITEPFHVEGHAVIVGASAGVSTLPDDTDSPEALIHYADLALYHAKSAGGGEAKAFDHTVLSSVDDRRRLELELVDAIEGDQITLAFQPVFAADRRRIVGAEALARWRRPADGNMVPPSVFIPLAESVNVIARLDRQVLVKALAHTARLVAKGIDPGVLFVNMSVRTFADPDIVRDVAAALREAQVPGRMVVIELTESFAVRNADITSQTMRRIAETGIRFAVDDFGTGYTSLRLVSTLPISFIKVDKTFIHDLGRADRPNARHVVRAIADLTHTMGIDVVAEGVETEDEFQTLAALQCDYYQGDLLAGPMPPPEFERLLVKARGAVSLPS